MMIRILLAEDDDSMRVYLTRALERVGYSVASVDRGTAALALLKREVFDLLLTDIVMPEMDGIELAQHAGTLAPEMRVMFITGFAAVALRRGDIQPKARILSKPFHLRELVGEVERMFTVGTAAGG
jgi:two-component system cell cycle response regulator CpdR